MTDVYLLRTCVMCGARAAKPRVGTLGESKPGLWCSQCGYTWEPTKAPPVNLLSAGPLMSDVADLVHTHVTKHIGASSAAGLPQLITDPYDRAYIQAATTSQLNRAGTSIGHPRRSGETDDAYRARLLS